MLDFLQWLSGPIPGTLFVGAIILLVLAWEAVQRSETYLRWAVRQFPRNAELHYKLGYALSKNAQHADEAERLLRRAIVLNPALSDAYHFLAYLLSIKSSDYGDLEKICHEMLQRFPGDAYAYCMLGKWHEKEGHAQEAEQAYRKAIEIAPRFEAGYDYLTSFLFYRDRAQEAEEIYQAHRDLLSSTSASYHMKRAVGFGERGDYEAALVALRQAIQKEPKNAKLHIAAGALLASTLKRAAEAEDALRRGIALDPSDADGYAQYGLLLGNQTNRYKEAEQAFRQAVALDSKQPQRYLQLGWLLEDKLQDTEGAEQAYRKAVELAPDQPYGYQLLGALLLEKCHRYPEAEAMFEAALELNPNDPTALYNVACAKSQCSDIDEALEYLRRAIKQGFERSKAWNDADLEPLRSDPRFVRIVGERPEPPVTSSP